MVDTASGVEVEVTEHHTDGHVERTPPGQHSGAASMGMRGQSQGPQPHQHSPTQPGATALHLQVADTTGAYHRQGVQIPQAQQASPRQPLSEQAHSHLQPPAPAHNFTTPSSKPGLSSKPATSGAPSDPNQHPADSHVSEAGSHGRAASGSARDGGRGVKRGAASGAAAAPQSAAAGQHGALAQGRGNLQQQPAPASSSAAGPLKRTSASAAAANGSGVGAARTSGAGSRGGVGLEASSAGMHRAGSTTAGSPRRHQHTPVMVQSTTGHALSRSLTPPAMFGAHRFRSPLAGIVPQTEGFVNTWKDRRADVGTLLQSQAPLQQQQQPQQPLAQRQGEPKAQQRVARVSGTMVTPPPAPRVRSPHRTSAQRVVASTAAAAPLLGTPQGTPLTTPTGTPQAGHITATAAATPVMDAPMTTPVFTPVAGQMQGQQAAAMQVVGTASVEVRILERVAEAALMLPAIGAAQPDGKQQLDPGAPVQQTVQTAAATGVLEAVAGTLAASATSLPPSMIASALSAPPLDLPVPTAWSLARGTVPLKPSAGAEAPAMAPAPAPHASAEDTRCQQVCIAIAAGPEGAVSGAVPHAAAAEAQAMGAVAVQPVATTLAAPPSTMPAHPVLQLEQQPAMAEQHLTSPDTQHSAPQVGQPLAVVQVQLSAAEHPAAAAEEHTWDQDQVVVHPVAVEEQGMDQQHVPSLLSNDQAAQLQLPAGDHPLAAERQQGMDETQDQECIPSLPSTQEIDEVQMALQELDAIMGLSSPTTEAGAAAGVGHIRVTEQGSNPIMESTGEAGAAEIKDATMTGQRNNPDMLHAIVGFSSKTTEAGTSEAGAAGMGNATWTAAGIGSVNMTGQGINPVVVAGVCNALAEPADTDAMTAQGTKPVEDAAMPAGIATAAAGPADTDTGGAAHNLSVSAAAAGQPPLQVEGRLGQKEEEEVARPPTDTPPAAYVAGGPAPVSSEAAPMLAELLLLPAIQHPPLPGPLAVLQHAQPPAAAAQAVDNPSLAAKPPETAPPVAQLPSALLCAADSPSPTPHDAGQTLATKETSPDACAAGAATLIQEGAGRGDGAIQAGTSQQEWGLATPEGHALQVQAIPATVAATAAIQVTTGTQPDEPPPPVEPKAPPVPTYDQPVYLSPAPEAHAHPRSHLHRLLPPATTPTASRPVGLQFPQDLMQVPMLPLSGPYKASVRSIGDAEDGMKFQHTVRSVGNAEESGEQVAASQGSMRARGIGIHATWEAPEQAADTAFRGNHQEVPGMPGHLASPGADRLASGGARFQSEFSAPPFIAHKDASGPQQQQQQQQQALASPPPAIAAADVSRSQQQQHEPKPAPVTPHSLGNVTAAAAHNPTSGAVSAQAALAGEQVQDQHLTAAQVCEGRPASSEQQGHGLADAIAASDAGGITAGAQQVALVPPALVQEPALQPVSDSHRLAPAQIAEPPVVPAPDHCNEDSSRLGRAVAAECAVDGGSNAAATGVAVQPLTAPAMHVVSTHAPVRAAAAEGPGGKSPQQTGAAAEARSPPQISAQTASVGKQSVPRGGTPAAAAAAAGCTVVSDDHIPGRGGQVPSHAPKHLPFASVLGSELACALNRAVRMATATPNSTQTSGCPAAGVTPTTTSIPSSTRAAEAPVAGASMAAGSAHGSQPGGSPPAPSNAVQRSPPLIATASAPAGIVGRDDLINAHTVHDTATQAEAPAEAPADGHEQVAAERQQAGAAAEDQHVVEVAHNAVPNVRILHPVLKPPQVAVPTQHAPPHRQQPSEDPLRVSRRTSARRVSGAAAAIPATRTTPNSKNYSKRRSGGSARAKPRKQPGTGVRRKRLSREFEAAGAEEVPQQPAAASVQGINPFHQPTGRQANTALATLHGAGGKEQQQTSCMQAQKNSDPGVAGGAPAMLISQAGSQAGSAAASGAVLVVAAAEAAAERPTIVPPADYEPLLSMAQLHVQQPLAQRQMQQPGQMSTAAAGSVILPAPGHGLLNPSPVGHALRGPGPRQTCDQDAPGIADRQHPALEPCTSPQAPQRESKQGLRIQDLLSRTAARRRGLGGAACSGPSPAHVQGDRGRSGAAAAAGAGPEELLPATATLASPAVAAQLAGHAVAQALGSAQDAVGEQEQAELEPDTSIRAPQQRVRQGLRIQDFFSRAPARPQLRRATGSGLDQGHASGQGDRDRGHLHEGQGQGDRDSGQARLPEQCNNKRRFEVGPGEGSDPSQSEVEGGEHHQHKRRRMAAGDQCGQSEGSEGGVSGAPVDMDPEAALPDPAPQPFVPGVTTIGALMNGSFLMTARQALQIFARYRLPMRIDAAPTQHRSASSAEAIKARLEDALTLIRKQPLEPLPMQLEDHGADMEVDQQGSDSEQEQEAGVAAGPAPVPKQPMQPRQTQPEHEHAGGEEEQMQQGQEQGHEQIEETGAVTLPAAPGAHPKGAQHLQEAQVPPLQRQGRACISHPPPTAAAAVVEGHGPQAAAPSRHPGAKAGSPAVPGQHAGKQGGQPSGRVVPAGRRGGQAVKGAPRKEGASFGNVRHLNITAVPTWRATRMPDKAPVAPAQPSLGRDQGAPLARAQAAKARASGLARPAQGASVPDKQVGKHLGAAAEGAQHVGGPAHVRHAKAAHGKPPVPPAADKPLPVGVQRGSGRASQVARAPTKPRPSGAGSAGGKPGVQSQRQQAIPHPSGAEAAGRKGKETGGQSQAEPAAAQPELQQTEGQLLQHPASIAPPPPSPAAPALPAAGTPAGITPQASAAAAKAHVSPFTRLARLLLSRLEEELQKDLEAAMKEVDGQGPGQPTGGDQDKAVNGEALAQAAGMERGREDSGGGGGAAAGVHQRAASQPGGPQAGGNTPTSTPAGCGMPAGASGTPGTTTTSTGKGLSHGSGGTSSSLHLDSPPFEPLPPLPSIPPPPLATPKTAVTEAPTPFTLWGAALTGPSGGSDMHTDGGMPVPPSTGVSTRLPRADQGAIRGANVETHQSASRSQLSCPQPGQGRLGRQQLPAEHKQQQGGEAATSDEEGQVQPARPSRGARRGLLPALSGHKRGRGSAESPPPEAKKRTHVGGGGVGDVQDWGRPHGMQQAPVDAGTRSPGIASMEQDDTPTRHTHSAAPGSSQPSPQGSQEQEQRAKGEEQEMRAQPPPPLRDSQESGGLFGSSTQSSGQLPSSSLQLSEASAGLVEEAEAWRNLCALQFAALGLEPLKSPPQQHQHQQQVSQVPGNDRPLKSPPQQHQRQASGFQGRKRLHGHPEREAEEQQEVGGGQQALSQQQQWRESAGHGKLQQQGSQALEEQHSGQQQQQLSTRHDDAVQQASPIRRGQQEQQQQQGSPIWRGRHQQQEGSSTPRKVLVLEDAMPQVTLPAVLLTPRLLQAAQQNHSGAQPQPLQQQERVSPRPGPLNGSASPAAAAAEAAAIPKHVPSSSPSAAAPSGRHHAADPAPAQPTVDGHTQPVPSHTPAPGQVPAGVDAQVQAPVQATGQAHQASGHEPAGQSLQSLYLELSRAMDWLRQHHPGAVETTEAMILHVPLPVVLGQLKGLGYGAAQASVSHVVSAGKAPAADGGEPAGGAGAGGVHGRDARTSGGSSEQGVAVALADTSSTPVAPTAAQATAATSNAGVAPAQAPPPALTLVDAAANAPEMAAAAGVPVAGAQPLPHDTAEHTNNEHQEAHTSSGLSQLQPADSSSAAQDEESSPPSSKRVTSHATRGVTSSTGRGVTSSAGKGGSFVSNKGPGSPTGSIASHNAPAPSFSFGAPIAAPTSSISFGARPIKRVRFDGGVQPGSVAEGGSNQQLDEGTSRQLRDQEMVQAAGGEGGSHAAACAHDDTVLHGAQGGQEPADTVMQDVPGGSVQHSHYQHMDHLEHQEGGSEVRKARPAASAGGSVGSLAGWGQRSTPGAAAASVSLRAGTKAATCVGDSQMQQEGQHQAQHGNTPCPAGSVATGNTGPSWAHQQPTEAASMDTATAAAAGAVTGTGFPASHRDEVQQQQSISLAAPSARTTSSGAPASSAPLPAPAGITGSAMDMMLRLSAALGLPATGFEQAPATPLDVPHQQQYIQHQQYNQYQQGVPHLRPEQLLLQMLAAATLGPQAQLLPSFNSQFGGPAPPQAPSGQAHSNASNGAQGQGMHPMDVSGMAEVQSMGHPPPLPPRQAVTKARGPVSVREVLSRSLPNALQDTGHMPAPEPALQATSAASGPNGLHAGLPAAGAHASARLPTGKPPLPSRHRQVAPQGLGASVGLHGGPPVVSDSRAATGSLHQGSIRELGQHQKQGPTGLSGVTEVQQATPKRKMVSSLLQAVLDADDDDALKVAALDARFPISGPSESALFGSPGTDRDSPVALHRSTRLANDVQEQEEDEQQQHRQVSGTEGSPNASMSASVPRVNQTQGKLRTAPDAAAAAAAGASMPTQQPTQALSTQQQLGNDSPPSMGQRPHMDIASVAGSSAVQPLKPQGAPSVGGGLLGRGRGLISSRAGSASGAGLLQVGHKASASSVAPSLQPTKQVQLLQGLGRPDHDLQSGPQHQQQRVQQHPKQLQQEPPKYTSGHQDKPVAASALHLQQQRTPANAHQPVPASPKPKQGTVSVADLLAPGSPGDLSGLWRRPWEMPRSSAPRETHPAAGQSLSGQAHRSNAATAAPAHARGAGTQVPPPKKQSTTPASVSSLSPRTAMTATVGGAAPGKGVGHTQHRVLPAGDSGSAEDLVAASRQIAAAALPSHSSEMKGLLAKALSAVDAHASKPAGAPPLGSAPAAASVASVAAALPKQSNQAGVPKMRVSIGDPVMPEAASAPPQQQPQHSRLGAMGHPSAVGAGKGGVGKGTDPPANLALDTRGHKAGHPGAADQRGGDKQTGFGEGGQLGACKGGDKQGGYGKGGQVTGEQHPETTAEGGDPVNGGGALSDMVSDAPSSSPEPPGSETLGMAGDQQEEEAGAEEASVLGKATAANDSGRDDQAGFKQGAGSPGGTKALVQQLFTGKQ